MSSKVEMTDNLISYIKDARTGRHISASALSKALNRDASYISSLELKRLRTISIYDFITILCIIFNISEKEAVERAKTLFGIEIIPSRFHNRAYGSTVSDIQIPPVQVNEQTSKNYSEKWCGDSEAPELIIDSLEAINNKIIEFYNKNPKDAVYFLQNLQKSLYSTLDLSMEIIGMPVYTLKNLNEDLKKEALSCVLAIIGQYAIH